MRLGAADYTRRRSRRPVGALRNRRDLISDYDARRASASAGRADPRPSWDDVAGEYARLFADVLASRVT
jgi:hypothetical protein